MAYAFFQPPAIPHQPRTSNAYPNTIMRDGSLRLDTTQPPVVPVQYRPNGFDGYNASPTTWGDLQKRGINPQFGPVVFHNYNGYAPSQNQGYGYPVMSITGGFNH